MHATVLLIGATGNTGTALARALHARQLPFRALVRDPAAASALQALGGELVRGDLGDPASIAAACHGVDRIYLTHRAHQDARSWCQNVYTAARDAGVRHCVRLSAMNADPNTDGLLRQLHGLADEDLRSAGLDWTILRPNAFMQNLLAQAPVIAGTGTFYVPAGESKVSMVDVRDIAEVIACILADSEPHGDEIYTLTGPEPLSYRDAAAQMSDALGTPITYVPVTESDACDALLAAGFPDWEARALAEVQAEFATGDNMRVTDAVSRITGTSPRSFADFIADLAPAFRAG